MIEFVQDQAVRNALAQIRAWSIFGLIRTFADETLCSIKALATVNHSALTPSRPSPSRSSLHRGFAPPLTKSNPMIIAKPAPGRRVKIYNDKAPKSVSPFLY